MYDTVPRFESRIFDIYEMLAKSLINKLCRIGVLTYKFKIIPAKRYLQSMKSQTYSKLSTHETFQDNLEFPNS